MKMTLVKKAKARIIVFALDAGICPVRKFESFVMKKYAILAAVLLLAGCSYLNPFNWWKQPEPAAAVAHFEPNRFLWQAAEEKLSFMNGWKEDAAEGAFYKSWTAVDGAKDVQYAASVKVLCGELRSD